MVCIRKVIENGQVDGKDTHSGAADSQGGNYPGNTRELRPAEPEESDREEGTLDAAEIEAAFRVDGHFAVVHGNFLLIYTQDGGEDGANAHCWDFFSHLRGVKVGNGGLSWRGALPAKTAPFCWVSKWWFVVKTRGMELNVR